jgi:hypothetical protein
VGNHSLPQRGDLLDALGQARALPCVPSAP